MSTGPLPNFLIVGAMKAGTSSLSRWLGEHPDVFLAPEKELYFFSVPGRWELGIDWYRSQFSAASGEHAIGEATPGYLGHPKAPERIAQTLPGVRLIAVLRHPAERAYSQYMQNRSTGNETRTFLQIVEEEVAGTAPPVGFYLERGRYFKHLTRLRELFPEDTVLPLLFDDLAAAPGDTFARACRHLGIDDHVRPANLGKVYNARMTFRSPRFFHAVRTLRARGLLPVRLADRMHKMNTHPRPKPYAPMDQRARAMLVDAYEEETTALERLLGRPLPSWHR